MRRALILLLPGCAWIDTTEHEAALHARPTVQIESPTPDGVYYADAPVDLTLVVDDAETPDALTITWSSDRDGVLPVVTPEGEARLTAGSQVLVATVTDPDGKTAEATVAIEVLAENTSPSCALVSPADGANFATTDTIEVYGTVTDADVPETLLSATLTSDRDGLLGDLGVDTTGSVSWSGVLSAGPHVLRLAGADERAAACEATVSVTVGAQPTASITSPESDQRFAEGAEVTFVGLVDDPDGDEEAISVVWESDLDGVFSLAAPSADGLTTASTATLARGEHLITLRATGVAGLEATDEVHLVVDGVPEVDSVEISPAFPVTGESLHATLTTSDPEDGALTEAWVWSVDGVEQPDLHDGDVPAHRVIRGQTWSVSVTVDDGVSVSAPGTSAVTVDNAPPAGTTVSLSPDPLHAGDVAVATASATDADDDAVSFTLAWTMNGVGAGSGSTLTGFVRGDTVAVTATPSDGIADGAPATTTLVVANAPPVITGVEITPAGAEAGTDNLVCVASASDADADALSWTFRWAVDGVAWSGSTSTTTHADDTILARSTADGGIWSCTVEVDDGTDTTSASVALGVAAPFAGWGETYDALLGLRITNGLAWYGWAGAAAADLNGDGAGDLIVGTDRNAAVVFDHGRLGALGWLNPEYETDLSVDEVGDAKGTFVGDVDGDGEADDAVLVGTTGTYILLGDRLAAAWGGVLHASTDVDWTLDGADGDWGAAGAVADLDGDDLADVVLTATDTDRLGIVLNKSLPSGGAVDLAGADGRWTLPSGGGWGESVAAADFDGDGLADVAVGDWESATACVVSGALLEDAGTFCDVGLSLTGNDDWAGQWLETAEDVDGDGLAELLVTAPLVSDVETEAGRLYVVDGASMGALSGTLALDTVPMWIDGTEAGLTLGWSVAPHRVSGELDVDADGRNDIMVGSYTGTNPADTYGGAWLVLGSRLAAGHVTTDDAETQFYSTGSLNGAHGMGSAGDVDDDGIEDVWVFWYDTYVDMTVIASP